MAAEGGTNNSTIITMIVLIAIVLGALFYFNGLGQQRERDRAEEARTKEVLVPAATPTQNVNR